MEPNAMQCNVITFLQVMLCQGIGIEPQRLRCKAALSILRPSFSVPLDGAAMIGGLEGG
jgi:hypothetical protein